MQSRRILLVLVRTRLALELEPRTSKSAGRDDSCGIDRETLELARVESLRDPGTHRIFLALLLYGSSNRPAQFNMTCVGHVVSNMLIHDGTAR